MTFMPNLLEDALKSLPHGPEFRFVDRLLSLVPGKKGVGEYLVRGDEYYLRGHLQGEPLFPGVLLIEAAAQVAGMVAQNDPDFPAFQGLKLTALRAVKILGTARPGNRVARGRYHWPIGSLNTSQGYGLRLGCPCNVGRTHLVRHDGRARPSPDSACVIWRIRRWVRPLIVLPAAFSSSETHLPLPTSWFGNTALTRPAAQ